jgi:hypothetical protein
LGAFELDFWFEIVHELSYASISVFDYHLMNVIEMCLNACSLAKFAMGFVL